MDSTAEEVYATFVSWFVFQLLKRNSWKLLSSTDRVPGSGRYQESRLSKGYQNFRTHWDQISQISYHIKLMRIYIHANQAIYNWGIKLKQV